MGAGHTVTALYEIIPVGVKSDFIKSVDELKYQKGQITNHASSDELMTVKLRYKKPKEDTSLLLSTVIKDQSTKLTKSSDNFKFSAAAAEFGMLLRDSEFKSKASYENVIELANTAKGKDTEGYRAEFVQLVKKASLLAVN